MTVWRRGGKANKDAGLYVTVTGYTGGQPVRRTFHSSTADIGIARQIEAKANSLLVQRQF
jgi:hypothetical protein